MIALLGFGNQGRAHAMNLRDSGMNVVVGARAGGKGAQAASREGFVILDIAEAAEIGDLVIMALPDQIQGEVYRVIEPSLKASATIGFIHGFSIHFKLIEPRKDLGIVLVAPKGPGTLLRDLFAAGKGLPALLAVHQDNAAKNADAIALAWAGGIGSGRAGIIRTTFAAETETDLFGEQAVLCGGAMALVKAAFETLVAAGYPPELAYLECCHELKQVVDLVYERGPAGMRRAISSTAEFGAYEAMNRLDDHHLRRHFEVVLQDIRGGDFAARMRKDLEKDHEWFQSQRRLADDHPIEQAGRSVRALMPWLGTKGKEA
jgi:ketol-acid reductoisomerase